MQTRQMVIDPTAPAAPPHASSGEVPQLAGGRYRILSLRGAGAEASVYLAIDLFAGQEVALKLGPAARLAAEYRRSAGLLHPHLARPLALWHGAGSAALAFEYGADDLASLRGAPEPLVARHVAEVARALSYLHRHGIVHADVKPQNVVLAGTGSSRRALLVDLGLSGSEAGARGSLEYAAPEVLEGARPGVASDLYSLGVMLHELLSGSNPFAAGSPKEIVRAHFDPAPTLRATAALHAVVEKLLARDPRSRYAHADEVIEALAAAVKLPLAVEGEGHGPDRIGLGHLQGREGQLARIEEAARRAASGSGQQLLVVGPAGSGRSRLLRAGAAAAELAGLRTVVLHRGEGLEQLCLRLGVLLGNWTPLEPSVNVARERLAAACAQHPLAVLVDDADFARDWLAPMLVGIGRDPAWQRRPLLFVAASARPIDSGLDRVELSPLPFETARAKVLEVLGPRPWAEGLADRLAREVTAQPRPLEDALRDLAARGVLVRQRGRWELDEVRAGPDFGGCVPRAAARAAREAIGALTRAEQVELGFAAVLWPELDARALAGHEASLVAEGLRLSESLGLGFSRLAVLRAAERALPAGELRRAHLRAADMAKGLARRAHQLFRAGAPGRLRAALAAARDRLREGEPLAAARLYQLGAAALRAPLHHRRAALLCERAGDCLALAGRPAEARHAYFRALARGGAGGRIWQKIAKARWQEGRFEAVLDALARARAAGGDALAVTTVEARAEAMRGNYARAEELARAALPLARERGDGEAATRLHHLLGTSAWHRGDGARAAAEERVAVWLALRVGDRRAEADARAGLGTAWRLLARHQRSARETLRAIELYQSLGDERQEALAWNNLGVSRYHAGDWDGALEAWERLAPKHGQTLEEEVLTLNNLGFLYRERGDLPRAREMLGRGLDKLRTAGGYARCEAMLRGNLGEVAAREGDLAGARTLYGQALEIARRIGARDEVIETGRRLCELALLERDPAGASERAAETLRLAAEAGNLVEQGNLWRLSALASRARSDRAATEDALRRSHEALRSAGAALEDARTDCVECLFHLDRGEPVPAAEALRRARAVFERLGTAPDQSEADRLQRDVEALQRRSFSHVEALTQAAQRLAARTDPAVLLENALDEALLLTGAERGLILIDEGEGEPRIAAVRGATASAALSISRTVANRVLRTGELVAVADIVGNDELARSKSILDLGLRSVLCAPIRFGGRQLGILYVDSRRVGSLLSERDLALLSAFAALAGSALENARLIDGLRRKTVLLAQTAHELRSPLQGILGYAQLGAADEPLGPRARRSFEVITAQAGRLSRIVDRTLEMSQLEAGMARLARAPVDLAEVARTALAGVAPLAQMKGIEVSLSVAGAPRTTGDFDALVQVVTNLAGNAIQYSGEGAPVRVEAVAGDDGSARLIVSDRGPGIAAEDLARLFTPWFRAGRGAGAGLGLAISREIVRQHGGEILAESRPGEGTTFTVVLAGEK